jgi:Cft2 family RNA processing exonuclease
MQLLGGQVKGLDQLKQPQIAEPHGFLPGTAEWRKAGEYGGFGKGLPDEPGAADSLVDEQPARRQLGCDQATWTNTSRGQRHEDFLSRRRSRCTGSCHLVECHGQRILIDCGLYQGGRELAEENADDFGFDPASIDYLLLTHAHLDHCGRIRLHKALSPSVDELYQAITDTFKRGGNVVIPTFALERAQEILFYLREGVQQNRLPGSMQVFLDSPMAISATEIFERHPECYEADVAELFREGRDPFHLPGVHFTRETAESIALNRVSGGAVILAGSGMCTGGRVRHHLRHNLWRRESSVVFVGFAARGTLARQIIDGARQVHIYGEEIRVEAKIYTINGFSAHADQAELLSWHRQAGSPGRTFLVHGEEEVMIGFAKLLQGTRWNCRCSGRATTSRAGRRNVMACRG